MRPRCGFAERVYSLATASSQKSRTTLKLFDNLVSSVLLSEILSRHDCDSRENGSLRAIRSMGAYRGRVLGGGRSEGPLRCLAMIIPQQPAKSFATLEFTVSLADFFAGLDDLVTKTLVVSFAMIMEQEFSNCCAE